MLSLKVHMSTYAPAAQGETSYKNILNVGILAFSNKFFLQNYTEIFQKFQIIKY